MSATTPEAKARRNATKAAKFRADFPNGMRRCVDCKCEFHFPDVVSRGWPVFGNYGTRCDVCQ